jgi:FkbM family methyltransferase
VNKLLFAATRPGLVLRRLRGLEVIDISLDEIAAHLGPAPVVVEAGAADGTDTERIARHWPQGTVHAFEPVPSSYQKLVERTRDLPNVVTHHLALSDAVGTATMHVSSNAAGVADSSSLLTPTGHVEAFPDVAFDSSVEVPATTLDQWAADAGVRAVDFLWLDLQGMELRVLAASPRLLATARAVCLEVLRVELYDGNPLYDEVLSFMRDHGFDVAIDRVNRTFGNVLFVRG